MTPTVTPLKEAERYAIVILAQSTRGSPQIICLSGFGAHERELCMISVNTYV